jgi:hypothetical protein
MHDPSGIDLTNPGTHGGPAKVASPPLAEDEFPDGPAPQEFQRVVQERQPATRSQALARSDARRGAPTAFQRVVGVARTVLPVVQKLLPLLDGNVASAASNFLGQPARESVDLTPIEHAISKLNVEQRHLRGQVSEHQASLQRIEDQLGALKEAIDRNAREQEALQERLKSLRKKVTVFGWLAFLLLAGSIAANVVFYLRMAHLLR